MDTYADHIMQTVYPLLQSLHGPRLKDPCNWQCARLHSKQVSEEMCHQYLT